MVVHLHLARQCRDLGHSKSPSLSLNALNSLFQLPLQAISTRLQTLLVHPFDPNLASFTLILLSNGAQLVN